jgi:Pro-kumamolisin, activation domain
MTAEVTMAEARKGFVQFKGSERPRVAESKLIGALKPEEIVSVTLLVRPRPGSPPLPEFSDWQKTPPGERKFLSVEEYTATYGASEADLKAVVVFIESYGLTVVESHSGRRNVIARGTASQMNEAFGIQLNNYESPLPTRTRRTARTKGTRVTAKTPPATQIHRGFDGPVQLPVEISGLITAVVGLDKRRIGAFGGTGDPPNALPQPVPNLAQLYNFPNTGAADQTIGVLSGGGSYLSSDIKNHYFPSLPAGYQTPPNLVDVDLTYIESGSSATFSNNPGEISSGNAGDGDYELTQDICTSSTIAQGATVNVYFMDDSEPGWVAFLNQLLVPGTETQPSVVTSSWFFTDAGDDSSTIGAATQTGTTANTLSGLFQSVAAQGITLFIAAGDWGCDDSLADGKCHVKYPASDPWVTCVGGTVIGNVQAGPPVTFDEWVWSDAYSTTSPFAFGGDGGATGGGVSDNFAVPPYQTAAGIAQKSNNDNQVRRGTPDVAGMVGLTGFYMNGSLYPTDVINGVAYSQYTGTSCVAPLYCGLIAVINSATGKRTGFLNNIIYPLGNSITRTDVTVGNNDSGDTPPAKPYTAAPGWDACTGWGSLDGTKLLNGVVQSLFPQDMQFWMEDSTFGADEVQDSPSYGDAFWLVLEGFTPSALGISGANQNGTTSPSLSGAFLTLLGASNIKQAGPPVLESPGNYYNVQRIRYPFNINFPAGVPFPSAGNEAFYALEASIAVPGNLTPFTAETVFELVAGANPYFANVDPNQKNVFWLSQDLRVFTVTPTANSQTPIGSVPFTFTSGSPTQLDTPAAYNYIQGLVGYFNNSFNNGSSDPFSQNSTVLPNESSVYSGDSTVTPATPNPGHPAEPYMNYNFALARVRLRGPSGSSNQADNVKVFFRIFGTQTNDTDYVNTSGALSLADPFITYPSTPAGTPNDPAAPLPGTDGSGNINGCTLPYFADPNQVDLQPATMANPNPPYGVNNRDIIIPMGSEAIWTYFGCFLNVYDDTVTYGGKTAQQWLAGGTHHCIVAQIAYEGAPIENEDGVIESPENSDKLAQRNLQITPSSNPGFPLAHRIPQTFDLRPSPNLTPGLKGYLTNLPDELMIDWGSTPIGSVASIYWPQLDADQVIQFAAEYHSAQVFTKSDSHTLQCKVQGGVTYLPIPSGTGENFAGLFTLDLPSGVRVGEQFQVVVRRITSRQLLDQQPRINAAKEINEERLFNWRYVVGSFQITVPVEKDEEILPQDENLLAVLKWRQTILAKTSRWYPILQRYITHIEGRILGMCGDPTRILPSSLGTANQPIGQKSLPTLHPGHPGELKFVGKVEAVIYDRFGDFEGFLLRTEHGEEKFFRGHESHIEDLVRDAWVQRMLISITVDRHSDWPAKIVLLRS